MQLTCKHIVIIFAFPFPAGSTAIAQAYVDTYQYDALGRVVQVQAGIGRKTIYQLDSADNRSNVTMQQQLTIIPGSQEVWDAKSLHHALGYAEARGWAASTSYPTGAMVYGPYTNGVPTGQHTAVFRLMIDSNANPSSDAVVVLDVNDSETSEVLASRALTWRSFAGSMAYQIFELPFSADASRSSHHFEFRVWYKANAYINVDKVAFY